MTAKKYVNAIVGKIQCGADKKQEIRKQLTAEVNAGLRKGESMDEIVRRMGPAKEIAAGYNENMDEQDKKRYRRHRIFAVIIPTVIIVASMAYYMIFRFQGAAISKTANILIRRKWKMPLWKLWNYWMRKILRGYRQCPLMKWERF